uniref:hypothetical protein n=1 Tax=Rhodococcus sp. H36-A4 TaxID=3004353 RepID=UPI003FA6E137
MWDQDAAGVMPLPSGRLIRGRGLRTALPAGPQPEFGIYLTGRDPGQRSRVPSCSKESRTSTPSDTCVITTHTGPFVARWR